MVLLAKRVRANVPPENRTSTSSAVEIFLIRPKISPALSLVSIQHSAVSTQPTSRSASTLRTREASIRSTSTTPAVQLLITRVAQQTEVVRQKEMVFQFARRSGSDIEVALKFSVPSLATSFRDIGCNRGGTSTYLARHSVELLVSEIHPCFGKKLARAGVLSRHTCKSLKSFIPATPFTG